MSTKVNPPGTTGRMELKGVTKQYGSGDDAAVDAIDLTIEPGQFMTLLGPSGSGKTTTLNMLAGFLQPTSGSILVNGRNFVTVPPNRRNFGMVFQDYALFPHMSVFDNIAFPLRQRKVPKSEIRRLVDDIVSRFSLEPLINRKPDQLSGGQQQRAALARAIVFSPEVLLLDEPLGALDRKLRQSLQIEVKRLHRELGLTFVFVTHDQDEAMFLSDRIAVFNRGRIERVGPPAELYDDPRTLFVAGFLGEANIFAGRSIDASTYEWNGERLRTSRTSQPTDALLVVRPERVRLVSSVKEAGGSNSVAATVTDVARLGSTSRVDLRFGDGSVGVASLPAISVIDARPGDQIRAAWDVDAQAFVTREVDPGPSPTDSVSGDPEPVEAGVR